MPREKPAGRSRWRLAARLLLWTSILVSAAWASREANRFLHTDARFFLAGSILDDDASGLTITGQIYSSRDRVVRTFTPDFGRSTAAIPLAERRRRLLAIDWVEDARVSRLWPNRVVVLIKERTPVAWVHLPQPASATPRIALIDNFGVLMDPPQPNQFKFPILVGITVSQSEENRQSRVRLMSRLINELGEGAARLSEIDVTELDNLKAVVPIGGRALTFWLGTRNFNRRCQDFFNHYAEIQKRSPRARVFDLRLDGHITAKDEPGNLNNQGE